MIITEISRGDVKDCLDIYNYYIKNTLVSLEECELEFDSLLGYAKDKGYYSLTLNVWADNLGALGFYERGTQSTEDRYGENNRQIRKKQSGRHCLPDCFCINPYQFSYRFPSLVSLSYLAFAFASAFANSSFALSGKDCARRA